MGHCYVKNLGLVIATGTFQSWPQWQLHPQTKPNDIYTQVEVTVQCTFILPYIHVHIYIHDAYRHIALL